MDSKCRSCPYKKNMQEMMDKLRKTHCRVLKEISMIEEEWGDIIRMDELLNKKGDDIQRKENENG